MRLLLKHFRVLALGKAAVGITLLFPLGPSYAQQSNKPPECLATSTSPPEAWFVTVEPGVQLQVLDWGGSGEAMVLLTGLGDNAHVYDDFAWQFTNYFYVIGITRRGVYPGHIPAAKQLSGESILRAVRALPSFTRSA